MKPTKIARKKLTKREATVFVARSLRHMGAEIRAKRWRWSAICFLQLWLIWLFLQNPTLSFGSGLILGLILGIFLLGMQTLAKAAFRPGRQVHDWAVEQSKHEEIKKLTGKTTEELETLLQYHMEQGNIEAADKVSLRLMDMVEGAPHVDEVVIQETPATILKVPGGNPSGSGLPSWMSDGPATTDELEAKTEESNLPDWMKK